MRILNVAIDTPLRRTFDYSLPQSPAIPDPIPGQRLWVPFGRRRVVGVLLAVKDHTEVPAGKLRAAFEIIDREPALGEQLLACLLWAAQYYRHPVGEVLAAALPVALRVGAPLFATQTRWRLTPLGRARADSELSPRANRQRALVAALAAADSLDTATLGQLADGWRHRLRELERRGWVERIETVPEPPVSATSISSGPALSELQRLAIERIAACCGRFQTLVLRGVTGSGKTEVYLGAIEAVLARGQQALVLVPEIALTPQLVARFAARLATPLAVLHSSLGDAERLTAWRSAFQGTAGVVIGTRSAVFAPLARPGIIIVDEEHDASYKQQDGFRYSARDLAITRAQRHGIPVVLGSATPCLESLELIDRGRALALDLPQRAGNAREPTLTLVDLRKHACTHGISTPALLRARRHLEQGGQVLFFLNRRGYAPVLFCPGCGWSAACAHCDARLTVHQRTQALRCHHCGAEQPLLSQCPSCAKPVKPVGAGTERIEETLGALFPDQPQVRIDRDVIRHRGELEQALERINSGVARLLIGTQMLTKGHDFPQLTLVIVLNADQGLFGSDIRSSERLAQTIVQVAGRAGRADAQGEVLIQTEYPEHPLLACLLAGGYAAFARAALEERRRAGWPPFSRLALLRAEASEQALALKFLAAAEQSVKPHNDGQVRLFGPAAAPMERRGDRFRAQLLLQASTHQPLQKLLSRWLPTLENLPLARQVRWSIDVDPAELF